MTSGIFISDVPTVSAEVLAPMRFEEGRCIPLHFVCLRTDADNGQVREDYVVKLCSRVDRRHKGLAREMFAALLGQALGIRIPAPVIVSIDSDFVRANQRNKVDGPSIAASAGLNFGSQLIRGLRQFDGLRSPEQIQQAAELYAFDAILMNSDRRPKKHNLATLNGDLIAYDHEVALPYAFPGDFLGVEIDVCDSRMWFGSLEPHLMHSHLKGRRFNLDELFSKVEMLKPSVLREICHRIPATWQSDEQRCICDHLESVRKSANQLKNKIYQVLI
jgi:hypothetical protein